MTSRRAFVATMAGAGGALFLGAGPLRWAGAAPPSPATLTPTVWLRVDEDGTVTVVVGRSEMGQGVRTSLPMIAAEELDVPFSAVAVEQAAPGPSFQDLGTGGSSSTMDLWTPLRHAGAAARAMLVQAAAARWGVPAEACRTDVGAVVEGASGRRLAYAALVSDAARLPVPSAPPLKAPRHYRILGTDAPRVDGPAIVSGRARYGLDVRLDGMLHAVVARPPVLGAGVASWDGTGARAVAGVVGVVEIASGVAVVAENTWAAMQGRAALDVRWTESPHGAFDSAEHQRALAAATLDGGVTIRRDGAGRDALAGGGRLLEALYEYPFEAHACMEPMNCTVRVDGDRCHVWSPTQTPNTVQAAAARLMGVPPGNVAVEVTLIGGGFGRRLGWDMDVEAVRIARAFPGCPVHLTWTREDDLRDGYFQAASAERMRARLDGGRVVAWEHRKASTPHQARGAAPTPQELRDPDYLAGSAWGVYDTPYAFPALEASYAVVEAPVPIGPWRAVFSPPSVFARECFLDEVAVALGRDPLALRLDLLGRSDPAIAPTFVAQGDRVDRRRLAAVLDAAAEAGRWRDGAPDGRALGLAGNVFHTGTCMAYVVEVSLRPEARPGELPFRVHRVAGAIDCGRVVHPGGVRQQVESGVVWGLSNMKSAMTWQGGTTRETNFDGFRVLTLPEAPPVVDVVLVGGDAPEPHGVGEPVVCPLAPAVANALSRLVGRRIRRLPVKAEDLAPDPAGRRGQARG